MQHSARNTAGQKKKSNNKNPLTTLSIWCKIDTLRREGFHMNENDNEFGEWLQVGIDKGWVSNPFCYTHDGDPYMTEEEEQQWEEGGDPCAPVIKILD